MIAKEEPFTRMRHGGFLAAVAILALLFAAQSSRAATQQYFDTNGITAGFGSAGSFNWGGNFWTTTSTGLAATGAYHNDNTGSGYGFARFHAVAGGTTISLASGFTAHTAGIFEITSGGILNIVGSGTLTTEDAVQGFLVTGGTSLVNIFAPIAGSGGIIQTQTGNLSLYGNNTFALSYCSTGGQTVNYNNAHSFSTGSIQVSGASTDIQGYVKSLTTAQVTIANDVYFIDTSALSGSTTPANTGMNLVTNGSVASPGTIWSGHWHLPDAGAATIDTGNAASFNQISGVISGGDGSPITFSNPGVLIVSGANTYTDLTNILGGTLRLGAANTIASTPEVDLNGGTLDSGGFVHVMSSTTLDIFGATTTNTVTTINTTAGGEIDFSENTNTMNWGEFESGTLNVIGPLSTLRFGTDNAGLRPDQLAMIEFNSDSSTLGSGWLTNDGYLVPEPSCALMLLGAPLLLRRRRRRAA
jgi:autotransporter-associated beta strand protein